MNCLSVHEANPTANARKLQYKKVVDARKRPIRDLWVRNERRASRVYARLMELVLPEKIERRLSPRSTALHLAIGLFVAEKATVGQAAEVAGLSQAEGLRELGRHRIPVHYGTEELAEDLRTVETLAGR